MLDLSMIVAQMTQGQGAAPMTPLGTGQSAVGGEPAGEPSGGTAAGGPVPAAAPAAPVDPRAVADRVYELMRRDLLVYNERQGGR